MTEWTHWHAERDTAHYVTLSLKVADRSVNVLHQAVLNELEEVLDWLEETAPTGVMIGTEVGRAFAAGADVMEFEPLKTREGIVQMVRRGQELFERWSQLECPTVAVIRGYCLGGGLELAMACDYRVAEEGPDVRLGLPEVRLGIHPGYGGTVRMPKLIGDNAALRLMVTGKALSAQAAVDIGLIDAVAPSRQLYPRARQLLKTLPAQATRWYRRYPHLVLWRAPLAALYGRKLRSLMSEAHYPAPYHLIRHWKRMPANHERALQAEVQSLAGLFDLPNARQLVRLFLLRERLKRQPFEGEPVRHVHVVGAGTMGGDIAAWCALRGLRVTLQDTEPDRIALALKRAQRMFARKPDVQRAAWDQLIPDATGAGVPSADLVIEAITEQREAKQALYRDLESRMRPEAILATNTSSLPLDTLAEALSDPARLIGIHFFNPVNRMPLVELVHHCDHQGEALARAGRFVQSIGRIGVTVRSSPGFLVNRILMPYLLEAVWMVEEGATPASVDQVAKKFGMPMGPLELADMIGLDICLSAGEVIAGAGNLDIPSLLRHHVEQGDLGNKTGRGFYRHKNGKAKIPRTREKPMDCEDRLILGMVRAAVHCLHEQRVADADTVDAGVILGTGFPPWTGGPIQMVQTLGVESIAQRLEQLERKHGARFAPGSGWDLLP